MSISFCRFGRFWTLFLWNNFPVLSYLSGSSIMGTLFCLVKFHIPFCFIHSFLFFFSHYYCDWIISIGLFLSLLIFWLDLVCYWNPLVNFSGQLLYSSVLRYFVLLKIFFTFFLEFQFCSCIFLFNSLWQLFSILCQVIHIPLFH